MSNGTEDVSNLRAVTATGSGRPASGTANPTVEEVMAGFIVWLTRQDVPVGRRRRYHTHAERFLRWRAGGADHTDDWQGRYLTRLRRHGASDDELRVAQIALALLEHHLITVHRPGRTRPQP
jgi:hypothetical protein